MDGRDGARLENVPVYCSVGARLQPFSYFHLLLFYFYISGNVLVGSSQLYLISDKDWLNTFSDLDNLCV